jgi:hypothetical protein
MGVKRSCIVLCSYKIADSDAKIEKALLRTDKCGSEVHKWAYCAAQQNDHSDCCEKRGISRFQPVFSVCDKGKMPQSCSSGDKAALKDSAVKHAGILASCFRDHLPKFPVWDPSQTIRDLNYGCTANSADCFVNGNC